MPGKQHREEKHQLIYTVHQPKVVSDLRYSICGNRPNLSLDLAIEDLDTRLAEYT